MTALIDTCVVLDFMQKREPFANSALQLFKAIAAEKCYGYITAKSSTDIYYLTHHLTHSNETSRALLADLLNLVGLIDTSADDIYRALSSGISDFEDAVMAESAKRAGVDCIVTRDVKDYRQCRIPVYTPNQILKTLEKEKS